MTMHAAEQRHDDDLERDDSVEHDVRRGNLDAEAVDPALLGKGPSSPMTGNAAPTFERSTTCSGARV